MAKKKNYAIQSAVIVEPPSKLQKMSSNEDIYDVKDGLERTFGLLPDELILKIFRMAIPTEKKIPFRFPGDGKIYYRCPMTNTCDYKCKDSENMTAHLRANHLKIGDRRYIVDVLGNVCSRFRRLAGDKTFWRDGIKIDVSSESEQDAKRNEERLKRIVGSFLGESAREIAIGAEVSRRQTKPLRCQELNFVSAKGVT